MESCLYWGLFNIQLWWGKTTGAWLGEHVQTLTMYWLVLKRRKSAAKLSPPMKTKPSRSRTINDVSDYCVPRRVPKPPSKHKHLHNFCTMAAQHLRPWPNIVQMVDKWFCLTHQTQNICITFVQCRPNVFDVGPTLYKCYTKCFVFIGHKETKLRRPHANMRRTSNTGVSLVQH